MKTYLSIVTPRLLDHVAGVEFHNTYVVLNSKGLDFRVVTILLHL